MRIVGVERDNTACNHYRLIQPLAKLEQHGLAEVIFIEQNHIERDANSKKILLADVVVVPRPSSMYWFEVFKTIRKAGKIVVSDFDDDPFNTSPWNPYYRFIGVKEWRWKSENGTEELVWTNHMTDAQGNPDHFNIEANIERRDMLRACIRKSDLLTVTTPELAEFLKPVNPNVAILPNLIDFDMYPKLECVKKEIRIGWHGGVSHYEDMYMVHKAIARICKKYDNVKFVILGDYRFNPLFKNIPEGKFEYANWVRHTAFSYRLATLNLDIGICPIVDNVFNRNKSSIKFFEYSMVGAASIVSNIPPYSRTCDSSNSILCGENEDEWFNAMEELILDVEKRKKLASNAYDCVYENHNADKKAHLWADAFQKLLKGESLLV